MINIKKSMPRHIKVKLLKSIKEKKILKTEKHYLTYRGKTLQKEADFLSEIMDDRGTGTSFFKY